MTKRKLKTKIFLRQDTRMRKDCKPNIINWKGEGRWNNILVSKARGYPGDCWRILNKKISALSAGEGQSDRCRYGWAPHNTKHSDNTQIVLGKDYWTGLIDTELSSKQIRFSLWVLWLMENRAMESLGICNECNQGMISSLAARQCEHWQRDYLPEVITFRMAHVTCNLTQLRICLGMFNLDLVAFDSRAVL